MSAADGTIRWTVFDSELNRHVIQHRPNYAPGLNDQAPLRAVLLRAVLNTPGGARRFHELTGSRLLPDAARDFTMSRRLALAAARSPQSDADRGAPKSGEINAWTRRLADSARGELPYFEWLRARGVAAESKLPSDCQVWFRLQPLAEVDKYTDGNPGICACYAGMCRCTCARGNAAPFALQLCVWRWGFKPFS